MKNIVLVCMSGNSLDMAEELRQQDYNIVGYIDREDKNIDILWIGNEYTADGSKKLITLGGLSSFNSLLLKKKLYIFHKENCINLIFRDSWISKNINIQKNSNIVIFNYVSIKNFVDIRENVFINTLVTIGHNTIIKPHTSISVGVLIGGNVTIGEGCFIGMGAKILQGVCIGDYSCISSNSLITDNVPERTIVT